MRKAPDLTLFGLDAAQVEHYRSVRDCLPRPDDAEVRRRVAELRSFAERIDKLVREFDELSAMLVDRRIGRAPDKVAWMFHAVDQCDEWSRPHESAPYRDSREEWKARPTKAQALEVWNRFIIALQQEPVRIYRTSTKRLNEWTAEFRRKDGSPMFVSLGALAGHQRRPRPVGFCMEVSLVSIVDQMTDWLDGYRTET